MGKNTLTSRFRIEKQLPDCAQQGSRSGKSLQLFIARRRRYRVKSSKTKAQESITAPRLRKKKLGREGGEVKN